MKVAVSSSCKEDVDHFRAILDDKFSVTDVDETGKGGVFTGIYTVEKKGKELEIQNIFSAVELVTGVKAGKKLRKYYAVKSRKAICYLLRERLELPYEKIAVLLKYRTHASCILFCRELGGVEVKGVSLEIAVRRILNKL